MNRRYRCGLLHLPGNGKLKKVPLDEGGGSRSCDWNSASTTFDDVHEHLLNVFELSIAKLVCWLEQHRKSCLLLTRQRTGENVFVRFFQTSTEGARVHDARGLCEQAQFHWEWYCALPLFSRNRGTHPTPTSRSTKPRPSSTQWRRHRSHCCRYFLRCNGDGAHRSSHVIQLVFFNQIRVDEGYYCCYSSIFQSNGLSVHQNRRPHGICSF